MYFQILERIYIYSGKNNDLASQEKVYDVAVRILKEILEILKRMNFP